MDLKNVHKRDSCSSNQCCSGSTIIPQQKPSKEDAPGFIASVLKWGFGGVRCREKAAGATRMAAVESLQAQRPKKHSCPPLFGFHPKRQRDTGQARWPRGHIWQEQGASGYRWLLISLTAGCGQRSRSPSLGPARPWQTRPCHVNERPGGNSLQSSHNTFALAFHSPLDTSKLAGDLPSSVQTIMFRS